MNFGKISFGPLDCNEAFGPGLPVLLATGRGFSVILQLQVSTSAVETQFLCGREVAKDYTGEIERPPD